MRIKLVWQLILVYVILAIVIYALFLFSAYYQVLESLSIFLRSAIYTGVFLLFMLPIILAVFRHWKQREAQIDKLYYTDRLTLLSNREKLIKDLKETGTPILILIDIDSFQKINSFYGSDVGDFLLIAIANRLRFLLKNNPFRLYRLQADEFAVLLNKEFSPVELKPFLEYLASGINEKEFIYHDHAIMVNATLGVSFAEKSDSELGVTFWQKLLIRADIAMKKAKNTQQDIVIYHPELEAHNNIANNITMSRTLRSALRTDKIIPYYQPIINNQSGKVEKYECLARLVQENNEILTPYHFIDTSRQIRVYHQLTRTITRQAFRYFENKPYEFSINLSYLDIRDQETHDFIMDLLKKNPDSAKRAIFEIVESEGIERFDLVRDFLSDVKSYGAKTAIDDFGSGYSNFEIIARLKPNYLKIDASLIKNIDQERSSKIITASIAFFARKLGMKTIAEFVKDENVFRSVRNLKVDFSQGYYFGKPDSKLLSREQQLYNINRFSRLEKG